MCVCLSTFVQFCALCTNLYFYLKFAVDYLLLLMCGLLSCEIKQCMNVSNILCHTFKCQYNSLCEQDCMESPVNNLNVFQSSYTEACV